MSILGKKPLLDGKCNEMVYPAERYGTFHGHRCGRKIVEGDKCKIHGDTAVAARRKKQEDTYNIGLRKRMSDFHKLKHYGVLLSALRDIAGNMSNEDGGTTLFKDQRDQVLSVIAEAEKEPE